MVKNPLKRQQQPDKASRTSQLEDIKNWGYLLRTNEDMKERRENRGKFLEHAGTFHNLQDKKPNKQIDTMIETLEKMDGLLKENSIPYGRAGTMNRGSKANWYAMMMKIYEEFMGMIVTDAQIIRNLVLTRTDYQPRFKRELVEHLRNTIVEEIIPRMKQVEDFSWQDQDVTSKFNYLIQSQVVPGRSQGLDIDKEAMKI